MIYIKNTQNKIKIDKKKIIYDIKKILNILGYDEFDISLWITTNRTIQRFNKIFRNINKPTDILSFAYHIDLKPGEKISPKDEDDKNLGDLIISAEYTKKDAEKNWNQTFEQRLQILLVHGICHLLGYDHIENKDYEIMNQKEKYILKKLNNSIYKF